MVDTETMNIHTRSFLQKSYIGSKHGLNNEQQTNQPWWQATNINIPVHTCMHVLKHTEWIGLRRVISSHKLTEYTISKPLHTWFQKFNMKIMLAHFIMKVWNYSNIQEDMLLPLVTKQKGTCLIYSILRPPYKDLVHKNHHHLCKFFESAPFKWPFIKSDREAIWECSN